MSDGDIDDLRRQWSAFAPGFASGFQEFSVVLAQALMAHLRLAEATAVVEVGSGPGAAARALYRELPAGARLVASDLAPQMVALARAELPAEVEVCEANAEALPFADGSFDRLLSNLTLNLVLDPDRALAEAHRVLQPRAWAAWSVWGRPELSPMFTLPAAAAQRQGLDIPPPTRSNFHLGTREALCARIRSHGFEHLLSWYQPAMLNVSDGTTYADRILATPRWHGIVQTLSPAQATGLRDQLAAMADEILATGTPIGLDALLVVGQRKS